NPDCALKTCAGRCASAVSHSLVLNPDSRSLPPTFHDHALEPANTRCILPAMDECRKGAVTRRDRIDRQELNDAEGVTWFSIKHLTCKTAGRVSPRKACK